MPVLWAKTETYKFWLSELIFETFFLTLFWEGVWEGCWWTFLRRFESNSGGGRLSQPILRVPLNNPGTQVPLGRRPIHLLCCSLRLLMPPPVGFSPHTPYPSIAGRALSLNEETKSPFRGGSYSISFIETCSLDPKKPDTFRLWVASGRLGQHPWY